MDRQLTESLGSISEYLDRRLSKRVCDTRCKERDEKVAVI